MSRKGSRINPIVHNAFATPPSSGSRNRSPKMWNSTIRYITKRKLQIKSAKKSPKSIEVPFSREKHSPPAPSAVGRLATLVELAGPAPMPAANGTHPTAMR